MQRFILIVSIISILMSNGCAYSIETAPMAQDNSEVKTSPAAVEEAEDDFLDEEDYSYLDMDDIKKMGYGVSKNTPVGTSEQVENDTETIELNSAALIEQEQTKKLFILGAEKQVRYEPVTAVNMFWDMSRNFVNSYYNDPRNQRPMPVMFNSSYLKRSLDDKTTVSVGQSALSGFNDVKVGFVSSNETTFDNGAKIISNGKNVNMSVGVYNSTLNNNFSGGAVLSSKPVVIPGIRGSFVLGGGYYSNEMTSDNKKTGGVFGEYRLNRLKLNAQAAKSKYSSTENLETSLYFTPEFQLTDSISIKTRIVKNISQDRNQDEIGLSYKPKNNPRDFEFEINAANSYSNDSSGNSKFRFSAKFKI